MSTKRLRLITVIGVVLITGVIAAGVLLIFAARETREVPLPSAPGVIASPGSGGETPDSLVRVEVTVDNVQKVIETLHRPDSYTRNLRIETFYNDAGGGTRGVSDWDIGVASYAGALALRVKKDGDVKNIIIAGERMYVWYDNEQDYLDIPAQPAVYGGSGGDEYQMILTYEDVLALDKEQILDAGVVSDDGEICIYVRYEYGRLGYETQCWISAVSGLLTHARQYDGGRLIYEMTSSGYSGQAPDLSLFTLPDGTVAVGNI